MKKMKKILWIIVPCYNEAKVLPVTSKLFLEQLKLMIEEEKISEDSKVLFVDNCSTDDTWKIIENLTEEDSHFIGMRQSRNRGHQSNVLAGLMEAKKYADVTISIDCDGQDDISAMSQMIDAYHNGNEVVYGVRSSREKDTFFKRTTAEGFYRLLQIMGVDVVFNHADYRLVSKRVLDEFENFKEVNLFLRGMFPLVGFSSTCVYYERNERIAGESHYPLTRLLGLAFDGITSLSIKPIRMITCVGLLVSLLSFIGIIYIIVGHFCGIGVDARGWASTVCLTCFLGGIQLVSIGIIGEYVGKIYLEVKARPRYIISERTWEKD